MQGFLKTTGSYAAVILTTAVVTAVLVGGGVAFAVVQTVPNNSVNSAKIIDGSVRSIDLHTGSVATEDIRNGTIGTVDLGPGIRPAWAKVNAGPSTSLITGSGVDAVTRESPGVYKVSFDAAITGCGYVATRNAVDAEAATPSFLTVERASGIDAFSVLVKSWSDTGAIADFSEDNGFTVVVYC
jgi:hypothetical protein